MPQRRTTLLPQTLSSLAAAGFGSPRIFLDNADHRDAVAYEDKFGLAVTVRSPKIRTHGNWTLALHELYVRQPDAERYAIFQDDLIASRNLRGYLDWCEYPAQGYWNLYTFPVNQKRAPRNERGGTLEGWYRSDQTGQGAVALVFSREAVLLLLTSRHLAERPMDPDRGWRAVDGGIVSSFRKVGWSEHVHSPSLVQHVGDRSTMGNRRHEQAVSFKGEDFDALELIPSSTAAAQSS